MKGAILAVALGVASGAWAVEAETWCGLKVEPENRCSPYARKRDYSYPASIEWRIASRTCIV